MEQLLEKEKQKGVLDMFQKGYYAENAFITEKNFNFLIKYQSFMTSLTNQSAFRVKYVVYRLNHMLRLF